MKEKRPLHWTDALTEVERSSDPSKVTSKSGPFPNPSSELDPPLNLLPNRRHPETWPVEGSPLPSAATGATWGKVSQIWPGGATPQDLPRAPDTEDVLLESRGHLRGGGIPRSTLGPGLRTALPGGMLPLAPMVFWDLLSLLFPHVPEAYRGGTPGVGIRSVATGPIAYRPGLVPRGCDALLPRGPITYRLPTGRHQLTL